MSQDINAQQTQQSGEQSVSLSCCSGGSCASMQSQELSCQSQPQPEQTHRDAFWEKLHPKAVSHNKQGENGRTVVVCFDPKEQSRDPKMPNVSTWHNESTVCRLSDVLETENIPQKFFLSPKACAGILRRAESRGKKLPEQLESALRAVIKAGESSTQPESASEEEQS